MRLPGRSVISVYCACAYNNIDNRSSELVYVVAMADAGEGAFQSLALAHSQSSEKLEHQTAFRKLLSNLSEHLRPEDVSKIVFYRNLPEDRTSKALDTLRYLMETGAFSHANVKPLIDLLKNINRHDLVSDHVDPYMEEHSDSEYILYSDHIQT